MATHSSTYIRADQSDSHKPRFLRTPSEAPDSLPSARKLKVIVVDDEIQICDTLADVLNGAGFSVMPVHSGASAVKWARHISPDIVLCDVNMPTMNGIEVAQAIREFLPTCRIVLFSGQVNAPNLVAEAVAAGHSFELLSKPIDPERLIEFLKKSSY